MGKNTQILAVHIHPMKTSFFTKLKHTHFYMSVLLTKTMIRKMNE